MRKEAAQADGQDLNLFYLQYNMLVFYLKIYYITKFYQVNLVVLSRFLYLVI